jgi:DNA-binding winged helix-turn-helix (wHTH) protein/TolB-like protein/cytochrome c-type biogenesis protein CcmH/NrfG
MPAGCSRSGATPAGALLIGEWRVDPALNQISSARRTTKLEPKVMAVLVHLADRAGEVVTREALLTAIWSGVVVGDDSLTQVVIKLRKALGDVPEHPTYIQTIAKRGYRLVAAVTRADAIDPEAPPPNRDRARVERPSRRRWLVAVGIAAVLLAVLRAAWIGGDRDAPVAPVQSRIEARDALPTISIATFEVLGDDPQAELLARGIAADLVTDLSGVSALAVIGASASGDRATPVSAEVPPARYVVSGSVQRFDDRVRVNVLLTDAQTGVPLWAERFDRTLSAFFAIQQELGPRILQILPAKVSEAELRRMAKPHTRNLEAYEAFQRAQAALLVRGRADNETARELFRRAIALDASFARAYAGLALTYAADYRNQWTTNGRVSLDRAFELAETAHQINPDVAETYWVLAFVHLERRQHAQALRYLEDAVRLYPSFADGYALMGGINTYIGRPGDALPLLRAAMRLNPDAGYLYFQNLGRTYFALGDLEQARVNLEQALARNPVNLEAHVYLAALHVVGGNEAAAAWEAQEIRSLRPDFSSRAWLETYPLTDVAQRTTLVHALGTLGF